MIPYIKAFKYYFILTSQFRVLNILQNNTHRTNLKFFYNYNIEDIKTLRYFNRNQLIEIENIGKFYIRSASEVIPAQQLILTENENETLYKMSKTLNNLNNLNNINDFDISDINKFGNIKNKLLDNKDKFLKLLTEYKFKIIYEMLKIFQNNISCTNVKLLFLDLK